MKLSDLICRVFNPIKNSFQYSIGSVLYFLIFNNFYITKFFLGLIGFVIAYQSVYQYNDLMDYKEDKKDKVRKKYKPLTRGEFSREQVETFVYLFSVIGLSICFFVSINFGLLVSICLFLNFLHSSPFIRLKKSRLLLPNLFILESLKYSLGWFVFSLSLSEFPFILISLLAMLYLLGYVYYKQNINNFFKNKKIIFLSFASLTLYLISIFIYPFKLALLTPTPIILFFTIFKKFNNPIKRYVIGTSLIYVIVTCFVVSMLLLTIPSVAELNNKISSEIDIVKENITGIIPENIKINFENIQQNIDKINIDITKVADNVNLE